MVIALVAMLGIGRVMADASSTDEPSQRALRLSLTGAPPMGPADASTGDASAQAVAGLLWDGLSGPGSRPGDDAVAELAKRWTSDDDHRRWTFTLNESRTFSNGLLVEPHDVVASIRRSLSAGTGPAQRRLIQLLDGSPGLAISVDGPRSVEFRLSETFAGLPLLLSGPEFGITSSAAPADGVAGGGTQAMITSGAYRVTGSASQQWTLERAPTGSDRQGPNKVVVDWEAEGAPAKPTAVSGMDDWMPATLATRQTTSEDGLKASLTMGVHLNTRRPTFSSVKNRRAVLESLKPILLAQAAFGPDAVASSSLVPGDPGCDCATATDADNLKLKVPEGGLVVLAQETDASRSMARSVVAQLGSAGVSAQARSLPIDDYTAVLSEGSYDLVVAGVSALGGSAPDVALQLFASSGTLNYSGLADEQVDSLLMKATAAVGTDDATDVWTQANDAIRDQAVMLPVAAIGSGDATGPEGNGLKVRPDGSLDLSSLVTGDS